MLLVLDSHGFCAIICFNLNLIPPHLNVNSWQLNLIIHHNQLTHENPIKLILYLFIPQCFLLFFDQNKIPALHQTASFSLFITTFYCRENIPSHLFHFHGLNVPAFLTVIPVFFHMRNNLFYEKTITKSNKISSLIHYLFSISLELLNKIKPTFFTFFRFPPLPPPPSPCLSQLPIIWETLVGDKQETKLASHARTTFSSDKHLFINVHNLIHSSTHSIRTKLSLSLHTILCRIYNPFQEFLTTSQQRMHYQLRHFIWMFFI